MFVFVYFLLLSLCCLWSPAKYVVPLYNHFHCFIFFVPQEFSHKFKLWYLFITKKRELLMESQFTFFMPDYNSHSSVLRSQLFSMYSLVSKYTPFPDPHGINVLISSVTSHCFVYVVAIIPYFSYYYNFYNKFS